MMTSEIEGTADDMSPALAALPHAARDVAAQAIVDAFPGGVLQSLELLHGGLSGSLVCKIVVDTRAYVMRIVLVRSPLNDPERQFASMRTAASIGVAPEVRYANATSGVSISAFIAPPPGAGAQRGARDAAQLGALIRRLHDGPAIPHFMTVFAMIDGGVRELTQTGAPLPSLVREMLAQYQHVCGVLAPHITSTPCHHDLNPGNVVSDGERLFLIDWESAAMGDPFFDLAGLVHWFAMDDIRITALLTAYFGSAPSAYHRDKLRLMKQVSWCFYTLVFLLISRGPDGLGDLDTVPRESLPGFIEALGQIASGALPLSDVAERRRLSLIMANQALTEMAHPEFAAAVSRLSA